MAYRDGTGVGQGTTGTGRAASEAVARAAHLFFHFNSVPVGHGLQLDGHVAVRRRDGTRDINFSPSALENLRAGRLHELKGLQAMGISEEKWCSLGHNVPMAEMTMDNLIFSEAAGSASKIPQHALDFYWPPISTLSPEELEALKHLCESVNTGLCIPLALVKAKLAGLEIQDAVSVGSLGFKDAEGNEYDWEYGTGTDVRWI